MDEFPLLKDISLIFALSIGVLLFCNRLRIPTIVGFLITGILCGPHSLGLISGVVEVQTLANVGIILLLFIVGMEFSLKRLVHYKRFFLAGGLLQVLVTGTIVFAVAQSIGRPMGESFFLGCLIALSSTAIVLRVLEERGESLTAQGKVALSILIFQDILVVPMVLLTPVFAGVDTQFNLNFSLAIAKGVLILALVFVLAKFVAPNLLYYIAKTRSRELFLLGVLTICTSVIWITSSLGVSLSLGAFLAGLIISESDYSHEAIGDVIPFQDLFTSFFFVSMGMLLDFRFLYEHMLMIAFISCAVIVLKTSAMTLVTLVLGMPLRIAILSGVALCQVGEFSFLLLKVGMSYGIASDFNNQLFLAVSILTMTFTPFMIAIGPIIAERILSFPLFTLLKRGYSPIHEEVERHFEDHLIIVGFGLMGKALADVAVKTKIHYLIIDMHPEKVKIETLKGGSIHFGDATHSPVLKHAYIKKAKVVAITINDLAATIRIVKNVRQLHPTIYLIVRTASSEHVKLLYHLGADEVIADEVESTINMYSHFFQKYKLEASEIIKLTNDFREENYRISHYTEVSSKSKF